MTESILADIQAELDRLQGQHPGQQRLVVVYDRLQRPGIVQVSDGGVTLWGEAERVLEVLRRARRDDIVDVGPIRGWVAAWAALSIFSGDDEQPDVPMRWRIYHRSEADHGDEYGPGPWFCILRGEEDAVPGGSYTTREEAVVACWEEAVRHVAESDEPLQ